MTHDVAERQTEALLILAAINWRLGQIPPQVSAPASGLTTLSVSPTVALAINSPAKTLATVILNQQQTTAATQPRPAFDVLWPPEQANQDAPLVEAMAILLAQDPNHAYEQANAATDRFQGDEAKNYLRAGHLLLLLQDLDLAEAIYQRGKTFSPSSTMFQGPLNQIGILRQAAQSNAQDGEVLILKKKTRDLGLAKLQQAADITPFSSSIQLKLANALFKAKQKTLASEAMTRAVWLQPGLLSSKGFRKKYRQLVKPTPPKP
jgi:tetratricopeptide (TPR) repeat protein